MSPINVLKVILETSFSSQSLALDNLIRTTKRLNTQITQNNRMQKRTLVTVTAQQTH